jgi:hypothetical protein
MALAQGGKKSVASMSLAELEKEATNDTGPFGDHLRRFLWSLQGHAELKASVLQILRKGQCDSEAHFQRLAGRIHNYSGLWFWRLCPEPFRDCGHRSRQLS